jgi:hypothetical protein
MGEPNLSQNLSIDEVFEQKLIFKSWSNDLLIIYLFSVTPNVDRTRGFPTIIISLKNYNVRSWGWSRHHVSCLPPLSMVAHKRNVITWFAREFYFLPVQRTGTFASYMKIIRNIVFENITPPFGIFYLLGIR